MPDDWIEQLALRFEGFSDQEIAQTEAMLPKLVTILALYKKDIADIKAAAALIDKNKADIATFETLINEIEPTLEMIANKVKDRLS